VSISLTSSQFTSIYRFTRANASFRLLRNIVMRMLRRIADRSRVVSD